MHLLGFPVSDSDARTASTFVDDNTAVPNTAVFLGGLAYTPAGSLYVCAAPGGGTAPQGTVSVNGRLVRVDGALVIASGGTPTDFNAGLGYTAAGALAANTSAPEITINGVGASNAGVAAVSAVA